MRKRLTLLLLAALAAGCGGGGGGGSGERLTRADWVAAADAVCRELKERLDDLGEPGDLADLAKLTGKALPIVEDELGRLRELRPPAELQAEVNAWLATGDESLETLRAVGKAADQGDLAAVSRIGAEAQRNEQRSDRLARGLGLTDCAED